MTSQIKFIISAQISDLWCDNIANKMRSFILNLFPKFLLRFAFKQIKLDDFIHKRLKYEFYMMEKSGLVFEFSCLCYEKYIVETRRSLGVRSKEHAITD